MVLSAVDQHVGKAIFRECIKGLLKKKIVLLVTNQLQYLPECDLVAFLQVSELLNNSKFQDGEIIGRGKYKQLLRSNANFALLLQEFLSEKHDDEEEEAISLENIDQAKHPNKLAVSKDSADDAEMDGQLIEEASFKFLRYL